MRKIKYTKQQDGGYVFSVNGTQIGYIKRVEGPRSASWEGRSFGSLPSSIDKIEGLKGPTRKSVATFIAQAIVRA